MEKGKYNIEEKVLIGLTMIITVAILAKVCVSFGSKDTANLIEGKITQFVGVYVMACFPYAIRGKHILKIDFLSSKYPEKLKYLLEQILNMALLIILIVLAWNSIGVVKTSIFNNELDVFSKILNISALIGFVIGGIRAIQNIFKRGEN